MGCLRAVAAVALALALSGCLQPGFLRGPDIPLHDALLLDAPFPHLVIEVDHAPHLVPCPESLQALATHLRWVTNKRSVTIGTIDAVAGSAAAPDDRGVRQLHTRTLDAGKDDGQTLRLHILYPSGTLDNGRSGHTAGRAYHDIGVIAIFKQTFAGAYQVDGSGRHDATCAVERAILLHELGHTLGLVNRGVPMLVDREAEAHSGHSTNPNSVMYPSLQIAASGLVLQSIPHGFDRDDLADLAAHRERP